MPQYIRAHMSKSYTPVPSFYRERLTIAILCNEILDLHWQDEQTNMAYVGKILPTELTEEEGMDYLHGRNDAGDSVKIRLDLIQNMPRPVK